MDVGRVKQTIGCLHDLHVFTSPAGWLLLMDSLEVDEYMLCVDGRSWLLRTRGI
jgi:hypothetical protein